MEQAWVLISAASEAAEDLVDPILAIEGVRLVDLVEGPFSLLVAIERPDQESLTSAVDDIGQLEGVDQALVCEVIASYRGVTPKGVDHGWP